MTRAWIHELERIEAVRARNAEPPPWPDDEPDPNELRDLEAEALVPVTVEDFLPARKAA